MAAAPVAPAETRVRVMEITVPETVYVAYRNLCRRKEIPVAKADEMMAEQLAKTADWHALLPIYVDDEHRRQLEDMLQTDLRTQEKLVTEVQRACSIHVAGVRVALTKAIMERLQTRWFDKTMPFEEHLGNLIREQLEVHVGLR